LEFEEEDQRRSAPADAIVVVELMHPLGAVETYGVYRLSGIERIIGHENSRHLMDGALGRS